MIESKRIPFIAGLAAVIVLAAGVWFGRPAYRHYKEMRSLRQARAFMKKGDYRNAVLSLRTALVLNPASLDAVGMMADLADQVQSPMAFSWRRRMVELAPTLDNKVLFAAAALRSEKPPFTLAAQTLAELRPAAETNVAYQVAASELAIKLNRLADAASHLQAAASLQPTNRLFQLNLATIRLQSADADTAAAARRQLTGLVSDPVLGQPALRSLVADSVLRLQFAAAGDYCRQLLSHPQATFDDRLLHLRVLSQAKSADLGPALARVQAEAATNTVKIARTISWMKEHGLAADALGWFNTLPAALRTTPPLPFVEAECYVTLRDWARLEERLSGQRWDDQEFLRLALLGRALHEQGRNEVANVVWHRALDAATRNEFLVLLAQMAGSWGWPDTDDILWAIAHNSPADDWALHSLMKKYTAAENTAGLYRVYQVLLERHPDSVEMKNNVAAYALLLNRDLTRAGQLAREAYEARKTDPICVSTYAFALQSQGDAAGAVKLMQTLPESDLRQPTIAAYYAILLAGAGERDKAQPYLVVAEKAQLGPEERRLLARAREK